jgi:hypothetical protein
MTSDARYHPRVSLLMAGDLYETPGGDRISRARIKDISTAGLSIETSAELLNGQTLYVDFEIAGRYQFSKIAATVLRVDKKEKDCYAAGLTFSNGHDKRRLKQALNFAIDNAI